MKIKTEIHETLDELGLSMSYFMSYLDLYENFIYHIDYKGFSPTVDLSSNGIKAAGEYRIFVNVAKDKHPDHWMDGQCVTAKRYVDIPVDEFYDNPRYINLGNSSGVLPDENGIYSEVPITTIARKYGVFTLFFTKGNVPYSTEKDFKLIHPYFSSYSLHGMMKLLLEWQWAYLFCDNREKMAILSNDTLDYLGLNVADQNSKVVSDLIDLGDMQVAGYIKNGYSEVNDDNWDVPVSFALWLLDNEKIDSRILMKDSDIFNNSRRLRKLLRKVI
jgi:hypothetical protein